MTKKHKPEDYVVVRLWGDYIGASLKHISAQQERAAFDGAPLDSTYKGFVSHKWRTLRDLTSSHAMHRLYAEHLASKKEETPVSRMKALQSDILDVIEWRQGPMNYKAPVEHKPQSMATLEFLCNQVNAHFIERKLPLRVYHLQGMVLPKSEFRFKH